MIGNNVAVNRVFSERLSKKYDMMYSQRAYVHWYVGEGTFFFFIFSSPNKCTLFYTVCTMHTKFCACVWGGRYSTPKQFLPNSLRNDEQRENFEAKLMKSKLTGKWRFPLNFFCKDECGFLFVNGDYLCKTIINLLFFTGCIFLSSALFQYKIPMKTIFHQIEFISKISLLFENVKNTLKRAVLYHNHLKMAFVFNCEVWKKVSSVKPEKILDS